MEKATFDDYVANRYLKQMEYYSKTSAKNQKKYKLFQWTLIILSALTPVLAALSGFTWSHDKETHNIGSNVIQILLVIVSSIVAILTTGLKTFQYQELWAIYRTTYEQLKPEIYYYEFRIGPYGAAGVDRESLFVSRVESILNKEHVQWPPAKKIQDAQDKQKPGDENKIL
jgi:heme/copper-type cytochrome/quinol oxidase subunit 2